MWLLLGYGSQLHSDDRFGSAVAEAVRAAADPAAVEVLAGTQLAPEWTEPLSRASGAIFVDASADLPPGEMRCIPLPRSEAAPVGSLALSHVCTPEMLLEGARTLYGHAPPGWLYVVGGENYALGDSLSPSVEQALPGTVARILDQIQGEGPEGTKIP